VEPEVETALGDAVPVVAALVMPAEVAVPDAEVPVAEAPDSLVPNVHDTASATLVARLNVGFPPDGPVAPLTPVYDANVMVVVKSGRVIIVVEADTPSAVTEPATSVRAVPGNPDGKEFRSRYSFAPNGGLP